MLWQLQFIIIVWATQVKCIDKMWLPNINYNSSTNWNKHRLPCSTDTVIFPELMECVIQLPMETITVKEIILSRNGEVIMAPNGVIILSGKKIDSNCPGEENIFQGVKVSRWLDYDNWSGSNKATPHVERIPCQHDNAVFPAGSSFAVEQPPVPVAISKFILGKEIMYGKILEEFLSSELGQREFPKPVSFSDLPNILATNYGECQHSSRGCECDTYQLQEYVCVKQCPRAPCFHPVKPLGFCCHICGSYMVYGFEKYFSMASLEGNITKYLNELGMSDSVEWHAGWARDLLQVVLVEKGDYRGLIEGVAHKLNDYLLSQPLGLRRREAVQASGLEYRESTIGSSISSFFVSMVFAVMVIACIVLFFSYEKDWEWRNVTQLFETGSFRSGRFVFARFQNTTGEVELIPEHDAVIVDEQPHSSFDNPMYSPEVEPIAENPLFSEIKARAEAEEFVLEDVPEDYKEEEGPAVY